MIAPDVGEMDDANEPGMDASSDSGISSIMNFDAGEMELSDAGDGGWACTGRLNVMMVFIKACGADDLANMECSVGLVPEIYDNGLCGCFVCPGENPDAY